MRRSRRPFQILLVEDDAGDTLMVTEALSGRGLRHELQVAPDGVEAMRLLRSYSLHANAYVSKPVDFDAFIRAIHQIEDFYLGLVRLPVE